MQRGSENQCGFTLIEVLFALVLFGIVLIGIAPIFIMQAKINTQSELRTNAAVVAQQQLDAIRFRPIDSIPSSGTVGPEVIELDGRNFDVTTTYCANAAYCQSASNRHVVVTVSYKGEQQYEVQTVYTRLQ